MVIASALAAPYKVHLQYQVNQDANCRPAPWLKRPFGPAGKVWQLLQNDACKYNMLMLQEETFIVNLRQQSCIAGGALHL